MEKSGGEEQEEVGIRCKMTEPEPEALEEREFVRAPSEKAKFRGKTRKGQSNKKRARRSRKSSTYRSSKQGSNRRNGRRKGKGKRNNRSRGGPKRAKPRNSGREPPRVQFLHRIPDQVV